MARSGEHEDDGGTKDEADEGVRGGDQTEGAVDAAGLLLR
jgi:hypothetical protein